MPRSKIIYGDEVLIDLTGDTVTADTLAEGVTAHDAAGNAITGTMVAGGGAKIATGTVTSTRTSVGSLKYEHAVTVTGLDFTPTHTALSCSIPGSSTDTVALGVYDTTAASSDGVVTIDRTISGDGFKVFVTGGMYAVGRPDGTYYWIAWAD